MKTTTNILSKIFVFLLALCLGWGGSAWAQTSAFSFTRWDSSTFSRLTEYNTPICVSDEFTVTQAGHLKIQMSFKDGSWAFPALGVDLVNKSTGEVKSYYLYKRLGSGASCEYQISAIMPGTYILRYWTLTKCADGSMMEQNSSHPGQVNISFTGSTVSPTPTRTQLSRSEYRLANIAPRNIPVELWNQIPSDLRSNGAGLLYRDETCTLQAGHYTMTFAYSGQDSHSHNSRLELRGVELRDASGNVVNYDCHYGFTGNESQANIYSFDVPSNGTYTVRSIVLPENGTAACALCNGNVTYTFEPKVVPGAWKVIITGDKRPEEQITYRNNVRFNNPQTSKLKTGETATVHDGEYFYFKDNITREELLDCDFSSYSPTRDAGKTSFVYGPVFDWDNQTITCEIREAITAMPETGWYQLKWDVSTDNNIAADTRHANGAREDRFTNPVREKNRFYLTMPKNGNAGRTEYMNYDVHPIEETTPLTFVKLVRSGSGIMLMSIDGRYMTDAGYPYPSTPNSSAHVNAATYVGDGTLDFRHWFPFGTDASCFAGKATNTHNYFYTTPAKFEDDRYEFYEVRIEADNVANDAYATYRGTTKNYNRNDVYRNGFFVFPKGHVPTVDDFTVTGATFSNMGIDIQPTATSNVWTLTFRERDLQMGNAVRVRFTMTSGEEVTDAVAYFDASGGNRIEMTVGQTYNLSAYEFVASNFSVSDKYVLETVSYTEATQTLNFTLKENMFSPAPEGGQWAAGTKWYTVKNVRRNSLVSVTSSHSENNDKIYFTDGAGDANSPVNWWCFVPDGNNGFVMYNKAFGPDFVLAVNSNYPQMTHKAEIAGKVYHYHFDDHNNPDAFTIYHNASHNGNAPAFNDVSRYLGTWNTSETSIKGLNNGSDFIITRVEETLVEEAPLYTPYKIIRVSVTGGGAPDNAGANSTVSYKNGKYAGGSYSRKQGSYIVVRDDHALVSVTAPDARCNDLRVSTMAIGASSITIGSSSTNPTYKTISVAGTYDITTKYIVHRPNGLLWKAKKNKIDGTESYTVGTQTPDYTEVQMKGQTVYLQNTNHVEVTHFFKPGDDAMPVWFTTTSSSSNNRKPVGYARMFNYDDEFDNTAIGRDHNDNRIVSGAFLTNGNTKAFLNGYANKGIGSGYGNNFTVKFPADYKGTGYTVAFESSRMKDVSSESYANGDEPDGEASYLCDFDSNGNPLEGFTDPNAFPGVVNMLEGTISQRQIFHLLPANIIADKLFEYQGTAADAPFMEEETIMFPTKNTEWTSGGYGGAQFHNVIPLGYNAVDYWGYTDSNKSGMFHLNHKSNAQVNGLKLYATVVAGKNDAGITINTGNNGFTNSTGIFTESTVSEHSRLASRFVTFCYPNNGVIGDGTQQKTAVIEVRLTNGTMTYNVKRFTLVFVPNTDPIPYDEIMGDDKHSRSDATLEARFGKPYEEMAFKMPAQYNFTLPGSELNDMGHAIPKETGSNNEPDFQPEVTSYYQFPLDFGQMSYNYYGGTRYVDWGEYGLRHYNSNLKMVPVNYLRAKYKMSGLKSKQEEYQTALNRSDLTDAERATYQQLFNDATNAVADNQSKMEDEFYNGYFIYCDASEQPGEMAKLRIKETLCPGTQFYVTAWMSNGTDYSNQSPNPNSVIFRIKGRRVADGKYEQIAAYCPGQISISVRTKNRARRTNEISEKDPAGNTITVRPWQQVAFSFTNTAPSTMYDEFRLEVDNNSRGSAGSDILFDNVRLYVKRPQVEVRDAAPVCGSTLDLVRITTDFDALMESIKGNSNLNENVDQSATNTYYGVYAILDKTVYDEEVGDSKDKSTLGKAFMKALVGLPKIEDSHYDHDNNPDTEPLVDKSLYAFHTIKFYDKFEEHELLNYNDLIQGGEREVAGRYLLNGDRALIFNCKVEDYRLKGGDDYMLVFSIQHDEQHTQISDGTGEFYIDYFNLADACRIVYPFSPSSATMVRLDGAQGVDPYKIDFCPGGAPNITLNSYRYDITTGQLVQEVGINYDWFYGTLGEYRNENVCDEDGHIDHTLDEALMNFRFFYPSVDETTLAECTPKDHQEKDGIEYVLTDCMLNQINREVAEGKLKLRKTNALFDLSKAESDDNSYSVVAIKLGDRVESDVDEDGNKHYYVYCAEPIELKFYTNHNTPGAAIGIQGIDYLTNTPYNVRDKQNNLVSVPTRISPAQLRDLRSKTSQKYLKLPINVMEPSGYYQIDVEDDQGITVTKPTEQIKFVVDPSDNDVVVAETNDPQWQVYEVSGSEYYMPVIGKLKEIQAHKSRKLLPWLKDLDGSDEIGIDFSDPTIQRPFIPREGYYYVLRSRFLEEVDEYEGTDDPFNWKDLFKHKPSTKFDNSSTLKCHGTILIPLKIVPEYMKWTGRESTDWNNDRNWVRADYSELVPSVSQNPSKFYNDYSANRENTVGGADATGYNGLPVPTNDEVVRNDELPYDGLDIYIPMEKPNEISDQTSPYTFGYAPMADTSILIPSGAVRYPVLKAHTKGTEEGNKGMILLDRGTESNTSIIEYDMVAVASPRIFLSAPTYEAKPYYENVVKDITFAPASQLINAHLLNYQKAWVEYDLDTNRWYTLASPLQNTYSGDWYSPTDGGRQVTPHFHSITYQTSLNDRFSPAYYQRSWDKAESNVFQCALENNIFSTNPFNVAVKLDWSRVYNDVNVDYSNGGFSVKPVFSGGADGTVLVRMPKADTSYSYYHAGNTHEGFNTAITRTEGHYHLNSDLLANAEYFEQSVKNDNESEYYLVANPFMATMDMDKFFAENPQFMSGKYWIVADDKQYVSIKSDDQWLNTNEDGNGVVAPLQSFFVKRKSTTSDAIQIRYTKAMQADATVAMPVLKSRQRRDSDEPSVFTISNGTSDALCYFTENGDAAYREDEDAELLLDSNLSDHVSTVFSVASGQALHVNVLPNDVTTIPLGVIAHDEDAETTLTLTGTAYLAAAMSEAPYLYDAETGTHEPIDEGTEVYVKGTSAGRYFIVSGLHLPYETAVDPDGYEDADGAAYDIRGIRVSTPQRGTITIQRDGRKVYNR